MKQSYVKKCKMCNHVIYGWNTPEFCSSACEYRYGHKEGGKE